MPKCGKRKAQPTFVDYLAGSKREKHAALEQIVFGSLAGFGDFRRFAPSPFVFEQSFEHADRRMKRRAPALGRFAIPAAVLELLAQEPIGQCVVWFFEI